MAETDLKVVFDISELKALTERLGPRFRVALKLAYVRALKRAVNRAEAEAARRFRGSYPRVPMGVLRDRYVKSQVVAKGDDVDKFFGLVEITDKGIAIKHFGAKPTPTGVAWFSKVGRAEIKGAFYQVAFKGDNNRVFLKREGQSRKPINRLFGPSMFSVYNKPQPLEDLATVLRDRVLAEIGSNLGFYMERAAAETFKDTATV